MNVQAHTLECSIETFKTYPTNRKNTFVKLYFVELLNVTLTKSANFAMMGAFIPFF